METADQKEMVLPTVTETKTEIDPKDIKDLSEEELSRIIGQDTISSTETPVEKESIFKKIKKELIKKDKPVVEKKVKKRGRPPSWTPERIEEQKKENALAAAKRREEKKLRRINVQIAINEPITERAVQKLINESVKSRSVVEKEITDKRTILKNISSIVLPKSKCEHVYDFKYFEGNELVTSCKKCSEMKRFDPGEWTVYHDYKKGGKRNV